MSTVLIGIGFKTLIVDYGCMNEERYSGIGERRYEKL